MRPIPFSSNVPYATMADAIFAGKASMGTTTHGVSTPNFDDLGRRQLALDIALSLGPIRGKESLKSPFTICLLHVLFLVAGIHVSWTNPDAAGVVAFMVPLDIVSPTYMKCDAMSHDIGSISSPNDAIAVTGGFPRPDPTSGPGFLDLGPHGLEDCHMLGGYGVWHLVLLNHFGLLPEKLREFPQVHHISASACNAFIIARPAHQVKEIS